MTYQVDTGGIARPVVLVNSSGEAASGATNTARLLSSAATTNAAVVKASAGTLTQINGYNDSVSARFLKIFDKATTPVPASDVPRMTLYLPPKGAFVFDCCDLFAAGIGYAITGLAADLDNTAIAAADILCLNVDYR